MKERIYIHYGNKEFNKNKFNPIKNEEYWIKPKGGLWASPIDALFGWKDWCKAEDFRKCEKENSFSFSLPSANIYMIDSVDALHSLPIIKNYDNVPIRLTVIDFEKCIELGYDAIELSISSDRKLYWELYGWDCDSILVMNPEKIKVITQVTNPGDILI